MIWFERTPQRGIMWRVSSDYTSGGVPQGAGPGELKPLGVPAGFVTTRPTTQEEFETTSVGGRMRSLGLDTTSTAGEFILTRGPLFFEGDEMEPRVWAPADMVRLQSEMHDAGLYSGDFRPGVWTDEDLKAYGLLLESVNGSNLVPPPGLNPGQQRSWLVQQGLGMWKNAKLAGRGGPKRAPLVVRLSNPDDLKKVAEQVSLKTLGYQLRPEQLDQFVKTYQGQEASFQRGVYSAGEGGGTVTAEPSPDVAAETFAEEADPVGAEAQGIGQAFDGFLATLRGTME